MSKMTKVLLGVLLALVVAGGAVQASRSADSDSCCGQSCCGQSCCDSK